MTPHIPEEFSTRLIDWSPFVIMGNTPINAQTRPTCAAAWPTSS
jgi:hypothetical protein